MFHSLTLLCAGCLPASCGPLPAIRLEARGHVLCRCQRAEQACSTHMHAHACTPHRRACRACTRRRRAREGACCVAVKRRSRHARRACRACPRRLQDSAARASPRPDSHHAGPRSRCRSVCAWACAMRLRARARRRREPVVDCMSLWSALQHAQTVPELVSDKGT